MPKFTDYLQPFGMGNPLTPGMNKFIGGRGEKPSSQRMLGGNPVESFQNYTPEQMQLFQQQFAHVGPESFTGRLAAGDEDIFRQIERPAERDFASRIGGLASRFSAGGGQGSLSSRKSSGFQNTTSSAAQQFQEALQSQRLGLQQNAISELMNMSNQLLNQRPYTNYLQEPKRKWYENFIGGALPIAGAAAGGFFGGPAGAIAGSQIGGAASNAFFG